MKMRETTTPKKGRGETIEKNLRGEKGERRFLARTSERN